MAELHLPMHQCLWRLMVLMGLARLAPANDIWKSIVISGILLGKAITLFGVGLHRALLS